MQNPTKIYKLNISVHITHKNVTENLQRLTLGIFHAKMGSIKDRNGMHLTEAEDIKKMWHVFLRGSPFTLPQTGEGTSLFSNLCKEYAVS